MNVWITGARGFIGQHAARAFAARGDTVSGLGHGAWTEAEHQKQGVSLWRNGEISHANLDSLGDACGLPGLVVHLAGGSAVSPSFAQPAEDLHRSVDGTAQLAEWIRLRAPGVSLVMASSAAVYGAGQAGPISERTMPAPFSPYGFHKRMAELLLESYAHNFGLRVSVVRFFSVYGPGLRKQLLWDVCTRLAARTERLELGGTGAELRDWLHVDDACSLIMSAAAVATVDCRVLNGGTGTATSIHDIAHVLRDNWADRRPAVTFSGQSRVGDPHSLVADASAAHALGWAPRISWLEGVAEYVSWFKALDSAVQ